MGSPAKILLPDQLPESILLISLEIIFLTRITRIAIHSAQWITVEIQLMGSLDKVFSNSMTSD
jgi:hypothetical protein